MIEIKSGSKVFKQRTGASNFDVRLMEELQIIAPSKTTTGWRQFSAADEAAAIAWLAERRKPHEQRA
jgi:hypothetical protein